MYRKDRRLGGRQIDCWRLEYLPLQLDDLSTIKASVEAFKAKESKLDVLWNNAGVALPPNGSVSKQEYELQMATNCLGPLLLTQLLLPSLQSAARKSPPGSVRIVWTASLEVDKNALEGGIMMTDLTSPPQDQTKKLCGLESEQLFSSQRDGTHSQPFWNHVSGPETGPIEDRSEACQVDAHCNNPISIQSKSGRVQQALGWSGT